MDKQSFLMAIIYLCDEFLWQTVELVGGCDNFQWNHLTKIVVVVIVVSLKCVSSVNCFLLQPKVH